MTDATAEFFERLSRRGHDPLLEKATGTVRFDLARGTTTEHWVVAITKGDVGVSRRRSAADCVVHVDRDLFDRMAVGEENVMAALLRGQVVLEGNPELLIMVQRLFPGPAASRRTREAASSQGTGS